MQKRLFIVHGWVGSSKEPMIAWLGEQGTNLGFETTVLDMPHPDEPTIDAWVKHLEEAVQWPDENTCFVGHSIGLQTILRYLQSPEFSKAGSVLGIAPWFTLIGLDTEEEKSIARPWIDNPINFMQAKKNIDRSVMIFSDNDPFVPLAENEQAFKEKLGAEIIVEHAKGHFTESDGVVELPSALKVLTEFSQA